MLNSNGGSPKIPITSKAQTLKPASQPTIIIPEYYLDNQNYAKHLAKFGIAPDQVPQENNIIYTDITLSDLLPVNRRPLPDISPEIFSIALLDAIMTSTRSKFAQLSIEAGEYFGDPQKTTAMIEALLAGKTITAPTRIVNLTHRSFVIPEGTGAFRFHDPLATPLCVNRRLKHLVDSGKIYIEGKFGDYQNEQDLQDETIDWFWDTDQRGNILGVYLRIKTETRWLPPDPNGPPLVIGDSIVLPHHLDARPDIDQLLEPAPAEDTENLLAVSETSAKLYLDPSINGVLAWFAFSEPGQVSSGRQIGSNLLAGGETGRLINNQPIPNHIRTEVWGPSISQTAHILHSPQYKPFEVRLEPSRLVAVRFYEDTDSPLDKASYLISPFSPFPKITY